MFRFLIGSALAAFALYTFFADSDDQDDRPPSYPPPYEPPRSPLCRCDENQQTINPPRKVDAPVEVDTADPASLRKKANEEGDLMNLYYQARGFNVEAPVEVEDVEAADPASLRQKANEEGDLINLYYQARGFNVEAPVEVEDVEAADPASLRKQANRECNLMKLCYEESRQAYQRRDHADSKALKEQGKRHENAMENLHAKASASIYEENNWDKPEGEVDLHRLYVKEAIVYAEKAIEEARRRGDNEIRLIVGKGIHADGGVSRLKPAIQDHVRNNHGIPVEVDPRNPGVLIVQVDDW